MKPNEITAKILERVATTRLNMNGFVGKSGMSIRTFRNLKTADGSNTNMNSVAALLRLMELAQVASAERYLELDMPGEQVVALRRDDFLALTAQADAFFESEKAKAKSRPGKKRRRARGRRNE